MRVFFLKFLVSDPAFYELVNLEKFLLKVNSDTKLKCQE